MKKSILSALAIILVLAVGYSYAVEVTVLGPKQYVRTTESPNIYTDTFPGRPGVGKIILQNGGVDGVDLVSGAIVKVNGIEVFGVKAFNQTVRTMERSVYLGEKNSISAELRSKPGTYLSIYITQEIDAEGAGLAGPLGGTIEVTDPESSVYGARVDVPSNALEESVIITIGGNIEKGDDGKNIATNLFLNPSGLEFSRPVTITYPFDSTGVEDKSLLAAYLFSEINELMTGPTEYSRWKPLTVRWANDLFVEVEVEHFSLLTGIVRFPIYTILYLPGKHLKQSDLIYCLAIMDGDPPGAADWLPGHAALYLGTKTPSTDLSVNDGKTVIESIPWSVQYMNDFSYWQTASRHIYMGARRHRNGLTAQQRAEIASWAIDKLGSPYWLTGKGDERGDFFSCVGLTEAAYESAGKNIILDSLEFPVIYPYMQFERTAPVDEITVRVGEVINFQVRGVLLSTTLPQLYRNINTSSASGIREDLSMRFINNIFNWTPQFEGSWTVSFTSTGYFNGTLYPSTQSLRINVEGGGLPGTLLLKADFEKDKEGSQPNAVNLEGSCVGRIREQFTEVRPEPNPLGTKAVYVTNNSPYYGYIRIDTCNSPDKGSEFILKFRASWVWEKDNVLWDEVGWLGATFRRADSVYGWDNDYLIINANGELLTNSCTSNEGREISEKTGFTIESGKPYDFEIYFNLSTQKYSIIINEKRVLDKIMTDAEDLDWLFGFDLSSGSQVLLGEIWLDNVEFIKIR